LNRDWIGPRSWTSEAGHQKALTAARLAITAIALLWDKPAYILDGMNLLFDRQEHCRHVLIFKPGKGLYITCITLTAQNVADDPNQFAKSAPE
jgi:hypothetical protein